ncbi:MAG: glutaminyl-peptide cyclotransferase [Amphiplicatus sp.]
MRRRFDIAVAAFAAAALAAAPARAEPAIYDYEVVREYPHDAGAFTQGLFFHDGHLYESAGQYGESNLRKVALETGAVVRRRDLPAAVFAEGAAPAGERVVVLTWREGRGFVFDRDSFEPLGEFAYDGEGWGLAHDGERFVMSDGSPVLRFLDPESFEETGRLDVTLNGRPLGDLNELEWVEGEIFANIWRADVIARIDPDTGNVVGLVDLRGLRARFSSAEGPRAEALNGIAYDAQTGRLFVTGKYWPKLFEIRLVERAEAER